MLLFTYTVQLSTDCSPSSSVTVSEKVRAAPWMGTVGAMNRGMRRRGIGQRRGGTTDLCPAMAHQGSIRIEGCGTIQIDRAALVHCLVSTCVGLRRSIVRDVHDAVGRGLQTAFVLYGQLECERCSPRFHGGCREADTCRRNGDQAHSRPTDLFPFIGGDSIVGVRGIAAVQCHIRVLRDRLLRTGVGRGGSVDPAHIDDAGVFSLQPDGVGHCQLEGERLSTDSHIGGCEGGTGCRGARKGNGSPLRLEPAVGQETVLGIRGVGSAQGHRLPLRHVLIRAGIGNRRLIADGEGGADGVCRRDVGEGVGGDRSYGDAVHQDVGDLVPGAWSDGEGPVGTLVDGDGACGRMEPLAPAELVMV